MEQTQTQTQEKFETWAIVEVMGHNRFAGKVSEHVVAGCGFIRVDVPEVPERKFTTKRNVWNDDTQRYDTKEYEQVTDGTPGFTKLLGTGSIYAITPCSEEIARKACERYRVSPVDVLETPATRMIEAATTSTEQDDDVGF